LGKTEVSGEMAQKGTDLLMKRDIMGISS